MTRAAWAVLGFCLLLAAGRAATAPEWAVAAAAREVPAGHGAVVAASTCRTVYVTTDHTRIAWRHAIKLARPDAQREVWFGIDYDPATDRILGARAWIIAPDGGVRAFRQGDFIDSANAADNIRSPIRTLVFDGNGRVPVGGTLACEIETEQPASAFEASASFRSSLYSVRQTFEVVPPPGCSLWWRATSPQVPAPESLPEPGGLRWEMLGVPAVEPERDPAWFRPNPLGVVVRPVAAGQQGSWEEIARIADGLMAPAIAPTPEIAALAARLTAGKSERWDRIRALADFVQREVTHLSINLSRDCLAGYRPHPAGEVLRNRYGDSKDKAVLLIALLRAAGEDGRILLVRADAPQAIDPAWPNLQGFNRAIVAITGAASAPAGWPKPESSDLIAFDPSDSVAPLGILSETDQGGWALLVDSAQGRVVRLPQSKGALHHIHRTVEAVLDENGGLSATLEAEFSGLPAAVEYASRRALGAVDFRRHLAATLQEIAPAVEDLNWSDRWEPGALRYRQEIKFRAGHFGHGLGGDLMEIQPHALPPLRVLPPWETTVDGVSWFALGETHEEVRIHLPPGMTVEEFPTDWDKHGAIVRCRLHYALEDGVLTYESDLAVEPGLYDKAHYEAVRKFWDSFRAAQRRPVLLRRTAPAPVHS